MQSVDVMPFGMAKLSYGCKTCALSSASCICVPCFNAGDHEGHDFYISRSDYGCCDCGDTYAWSPSGFCRFHPGPKQSRPAQVITCCVDVATACVRVLTRRLLKLLNQAIPKKNSKSDILPETPIDPEDMIPGNLDSGDADDTEEEAGTDIGMNIEGDQGPLDDDLQDVDMNNVPGTQDWEQPDLAVQGAAVRLTPPPQQRDEEAERRDLRRSGGG